MQRHEVLSPVPVILTPELARENSHAYKTRVVGLLHQTAYGGPVWDACVQLGFIQKFKLVPSFASKYKSRDRSIYLGFMPNPHGTQNIQFEPEHFSYEPESVFILLHETTHALLRTPFGYQPAYYEWQMQAEMLHTKKQGLTMLTNLEAYQKKSTFVQAREDMTELIAMYLWDPAYLSRYLDFLASESEAHMAMKSSYHLATLRRSATMRLEEGIRRTINLVLSGKFANGFV